VCAGTWQIPLAVLAPGDPPLPAVLGLLEPA
jgi:hypothetical protein